MKKINLIAMICLFFGMGLSAQKSAIKLGLGGLAATAANLRFETALGDRMSFQITGSYKFPTNLNLTDDNDFFTSDGKLSGFAIIPELRFYFGQANAGTIKGFYLGPYLKFHRYGTESGVNYDYTDGNGVTSNLTPDLNINLTTIGGGLQLGYHFIIGEHFSIDWHFLGFGGDFHRLGANLDFKNSDVDLSDVAQDIVDELNAANPDGVPLEIDQFERVIDGRKLGISAAVPFIGFRAGLSLGYAF
jgi:hypothetical protein